MRGFFVKIVSIPHLFHGFDLCPVLNPPVSMASRILFGIDEELFALEFLEWTEEILNTKGMYLVIDGKALRFH